PWVKFRDPPQDLSSWPEPVTTDAQGRFSLHGLARDWSFTLKVQHDRFAPQYLEIKAQEWAKGEPITRALAPARFLEGEVTYADTGKPVPNVPVSIQTTPAGNELNPMYWAEGQTDERGQFRVSLPLGHYITVTTYPPA